jgi:hypothetical protein
MKLTAERVDATGVFLLFGEKIEQLLLESVNTMRLRAWAGARITITDNQGKIVFADVVPAYLPKNYGE